MAASKSADREKFVRLGTKRVNTAIKAIQLVGNLSNRSNYDYKDADISKIFKSLQTELDTAKDKFAPRDGKTKQSFSLEP